MTTKEKDAVEKVEEPQAAASSTAEEGAKEATQAASRPAAQQRVAMPAVQVKDEHVAPLYANFCRVTGSPEELIVDFGLNPQPVGPPQKPIEIKQRVVMNFYTAKRLLVALQMSVQRHEAIFGVLETDINKRLRPQVQQAQAAAAAAAQRQAQES